MYSEDEKMCNENENEYDSSETESKEKLDTMKLSAVFDETIKDFLYLEPMLSSISFSDICYGSSHAYSKNIEKYYNKKTIYELSCVLNDTIHKFLRKYDDVDDVFSGINQNKIYIRIVNSFNKYYVLN